MRDIAVVAYEESPLEQPEGTGDVQRLIPIITEALDSVSLTRRDVGFWCSGSADYLTGAPFAFVGQIAATGAWPPISESHVEMDGAFALYEAWVRLQHGDVDVAVVYAAGRATGAADMGEVLCMQLDPYYLQPLWPHHVALAAMQAKAYLAATGKGEDDLAAVVAAAASAAADDPNAVIDVSTEPAQLLNEPHVVAPLRAHDCPTFTDGAAVVVLAAEDRARELTDSPVWIRGIDHRIDAHYPSMRDLSSVPSAFAAAAEAGVADSPVEVAELSAPFSHQVLMLADALGLDYSVEINPSGGALAADPFIVTGLVRIGRAAKEITDNGRRRVVAHASSGPALQQNLVCVMEGGS